jgi:predicted RNA-binding protein with TRAM domain
VVGASDFTLYIPGTKINSKIKIQIKDISSAWSADGQTLAFGTINGTISFRSRSLD